MASRKPLLPKVQIGAPRGTLARRDRIIAITRELIAELGIESITMRDLAQRCSVAVATLYNQFGSREAIIAEALRHPPSRLPTRCGSASATRYAA